MILMSVVLPEPFGPSRPTIKPRSTFERHGVEHERAPGLERSAGETRRPAARVVAAP